jgi:hypothetical protein
MEYQRFNFRTKDFVLGTNSIVSDFDGGGSVLEAVQNDSLHGIRIKSVALDMRAYDEITGDEAIVVHNRGGVSLEFSDIDGVSIPLWNKLKFSFTAGTELNSLNSTPIIAVQSQKIELLDVRRVKTISVLGYCTQLLKLTVNAQTNLVCGVTVGYELETL